MTDPVAAVIVDLGHDAKGVPTEPYGVCPICFADVGADFEDAWCHVCGWRGSVLDLTAKATAAIAYREHVIARRELRPDWAGMELWFVDGMGVKVSDQDWYRAFEALKLDRAAYIVGAKVTLEFVGRRWRLARLELAEGA